MAVYWWSKCSGHSGFLASRIHEMSTLGMSLLFVGVPVMHSHFLSSKLASTCTYLHPGILQVSYISLASAYDGEYTRSGEMLNNIALRRCWQSVLPIFQISLPFPLHPQLLTAGLSLPPVPLLHHIVSVTFFAQSNLPQLTLFYWSGLGAAAAISQLLTQTLQHSNHSKAATTWPSWMAATSGRSQTDGCLQRAKKLATVSLHTVMMDFHLKGRDGL